ncbi:hypothetical protein XELAEV_18007260mg [Xenopus laevis]|uniref:Ig-like domain-containing protein n=1 Tax=Xenopus laevis TaxID=8355 RepID=A0A974E0T9_XENLA|nr:hypothetical protein XELAEV_18007260mg [Xenopus laevis]
MTVLGDMKRERHLLLFVLFICSGNVSGDEINQADSKLLEKEEMNITMSCDYSVSYTGAEYYLFWYRQYPNGHPEYITLKANMGSHNYIAQFAKDRFVSEVNSTTTTLTIKHLKPEDSATYLCALRRAQCDTSELNNYTNLRG